MYIITFDSYDKMVTIFKKHPIKFQMSSFKIYFLILETSTKF